MFNHSYRQAWVEISLDAIKQNVRAFKTYIGKKPKLMAVVKADGYGHGAYEVAHEALKNGADYLAVALLDEALELRKKGIRAPILVLGHTAPDAVMEAVKKDITLTVFQNEVLVPIMNAAEKLNKEAFIHIKIDSGMHRIGIKDKGEALQLIQSITSPYIKVEGIFTHFADADNQDRTYTKKQFNHFQAVLTHLADHGIDIPIKHCCNTAATICYPAMHLDMVRVGIGLYGLYPSEHMRQDITLKQAMNFKTMPVMIKKVAENEPISYGCTYRPSVESVIATIPIGYADGFSRSLSNVGDVMVKGKRAPIVGRICMDQSMIDVTGISGIGMGAVVSVFGEQSEGYIPLHEVAGHLNTIHYEIVCLIGKRVSRVYMKNGRAVKAKGLCDLHG